MTKQTLIEYLEKDIRRLGKEQAKMKKEMNRKGNHGNLHMTGYTYVISRKHTLMEILELIKK